ncbi:MAG TPA: hypothetical protein VME70_03830 [Mycobacteriales bacterium]|nr:hypothetical protein [Mycobacteriales bacterium]
MRRSKAWAWASYSAAGVWHRRGIAVMILLTTMLAAGSAAGAFIYRDAAATSGLRARLEAAPPAQSGVVISAAGTPRFDPLKDLETYVSSNLPLASQRITGTSIAAYLWRPGHLVSDPINLVTSSGLCAQVQMVSGTCPTTGPDVALPAGVAAQDGLKIGSRLRINQWEVEPNGQINTTILGVTIHTKKGPPTGVTPSRFVTLVGTYQVRQPGAAYWMGAAPVTTASPEQALPTTVLTTPALFHAIPLYTFAQVFVREPLQASRVVPADAASLRHAITVFQAIDNTGHVVVTTDLPQLLTLDAADRSTLGRVTLVSVAQLLALLALVLAVVLCVSSTARRTEMMAANVRGRHALLVAAELAIEPIVLVVLGSAAGAALARLAVRLALGHWLLPGTPVPVLPHDSQLGVAAVAAGGILTAGVIALWAARRTTLLSATAEPGNAATWWEVAIFTLAVAGLIELVVAGGIRSKATPWALVTPTICGLAVALLLARGIPPLLGPVVRRTRRTRRLSVYLLVRELRRDVNAWRVTAVVAMAVSLLAFAVAIDRGAVRDRDDRAGLIVGADRVVSVDLASVRTLPGIVQQLDPNGRWAMAAVQVVPLGSPDERTLAVDAPRLAAVAGWSRRVAGRTPAQLAKLIDPMRVRPFTFKGAPLRLAIDNSKPGKVPESLTLDYALPNGALRSAKGQDLRAGRHHYIWRTPGCAVGGCRILSFSIPNPPRHQPLDITIGGLGNGPWIGDALHLQPVPIGLRITAGHYDSVLGGEALVRREAAKKIPAVFSPGEPLVVGVDSFEPPAHVVARAAALPRLLNNGTLVDLSYLLLADRGANPGTTLVQPQIWLGSRAPADAVARIEALHVRVEGVSTKAAAIHRLNQLDPALGLDAYLAVAAMAVLLALALLCGQGAVAARRRRSEYVALATAGVSRFSLGCGWFAAAVVRMAFCVGAGSAAGLFVARLAAAGVPLAARGTQPAPILSVQTEPAVIAAAATLLPLLLVEAFSVRWSIRTSGLRRARETAV